MSNELTNLLVRKFIARSDVKAIQHRDGSWSPHTTTGKHDGERIPWRREDLNAHLDRSKTFGHYLLNPEGQCKLFAFDIDLEKDGWAPDTDTWGTVEQPQMLEIHPRDDWQIRSHWARPWMKMQFRMISQMLAKSIQDELGIPAAVAYSGGKGVHVYGFTGLMPAEDAREAADIVIETLGCFEVTRGKHFFRHVNQDPLDGYPNLSIEIFPKQTSLDGKDLGNLMRLPLGRNMKSNDPTFFMDLTVPMNELSPVDPVWALSTDNIWERSA